MGIRAQLNRIWKREAKEKEPESAVLLREIDDFYREHPRAVPAVVKEVKSIRKEGEDMMDTVQKDFDTQMEETVVVYLRRELDYLKSMVPGGK